MRRQRGFLLNPYRFEGTVQEGAVDVSSAAAAVTFAGSGVASASASMAAEAGLIAEPDQAASGAMSIDGEGGVTMKGASITSGAVAAEGTSATGLAATSGVKVVAAAEFDGTNDYLTRASLTGVADSKTGIVSAWVNIEDVNKVFAGAFVIAFENSVTGDSFYLQTLDQAYAGSPGTVYLEATAFNGSGLIFRLKGTHSLSDGTGWLHLLATWNIGSNTGAFYVNDVDRTSWSRSQDSSVAWTSATDGYTVGTLPSAGGVGYDGAMAELFLAPGQYIDISVEENRRKFISSDGKPVDLGATGASPTGTAPSVYLHIDSGESANNFALNRGTGGNFTVVGSLSTYASSPSD